MRQRDRLGHRDCPASPASGSCISTPRQCPGLYKGTSHHKVPQAVSGRDFVGTSPLHPLRNQLLCSRYLPSPGLTHHSVVAREAFQVCLVRYWVSGCRSKREVSAGGCGPTAGSSYHVALRLRGPVRSHPIGGRSRLWRVGLDVPSSVN